jgi:hypothetical protein
VKVKSFMRSLNVRRGVGIVLLSAGVSAVLAQGPDGPNAAASASAQSSDTSFPIPAVREIDDPHSGSRWLLVKNADHPGGPGRLLQIQRQVQPGPDGAESDASQTERLIASPVIHTGDAVRVEEHTTRVDAVLEAIALGPAVAGQPLRVRLKLRGRIVNVIARSAGRVSFADEPEARR